MNHLKTVALLGVLSALLSTISYWLIGGWLGVLVGVALAAVTNLGSWYFSDEIALAAYGALPLHRGQAPHIYAAEARIEELLKLEQKLARSTSSFLSDF